MIDKVRNPEDIPLNPPSKGGILGHDGQNGHGDEVREPRSEVRNTEDIPLNPPQAFAGSETLEGGILGQNGHGDEGRNWVVGRMSPTFNFKL